MRVLSWNLYHGRDAPPGHPRQSFWQRLLRRELDDGTFLDANRPLDEEFARVIATAEWSICLLQETPPRWSRSLARACGAHAVRFLTSRNVLLPLTGALGRWNPDAIGSWEGGCNLTLIRPPWTLVEGSERSLLLNPIRERRLHERRRMGVVRVRGHLNGEQLELCVGNIHASKDTVGDSEREIERAARGLVSSAGSAACLLGGDFNVRPARVGVFDLLERDLGLGPPSAPDAIDHLLARGLELVEGPRRWPPEGREVEVETPAGHRRIRLSDHAPVEAAYGFPGTARRPMRY